MVLTCFWGGAHQGAQPLAEQNHHSWCLSQWSMQASAREGKAPCGTTTAPWLFGSPLPQGLGEGSDKPCRTQSQACSLGPPSPPLAQGWVSWRALGRRPESASYLTLHLMTNTQLLSESSHSLLLIDGCQWARPAEALTSG